MVQTNIHVYDSYPEDKYQPGEGVLVGEYRSTLVPRQGEQIEFQGKEWVVKWVTHVVPGPDEHPLSGPEVKLRCYTEGGR